MSRTKLTQQQLDSLAASFLPIIKEFYSSEEGKTLYQKYLDEKAASSKSLKKDNIADNAKK